MLEALPRLGLDLLSEEIVEHEMVHGSPEECWREMHQHGPLQVAARRMGVEALEEIGRRWLQDHGFEKRGDQVVHRPAARLWLLARSDRG
jgi:hypothetical protein